MAWTALLQALVARGHCHVQRADAQQLHRRAEEARENAEKLEDTAGRCGWLRAETEVAYVGAENMTRVKEPQSPPRKVKPQITLDDKRPYAITIANVQLSPPPTFIWLARTRSWFDPDLYGSESEAEEPKQDQMRPRCRRVEPFQHFTTQEFNQHLSVLTDLLANSPAAYGCHTLLPGCRVYSQTGTILRVPHMAEGVSLVGRAGAMDERDKRMAEDFMMWVVARRLCLFYKVEGQGLVELTPKTSEAENMAAGARVEATNQCGGRIRLRAGSLLLFRHDLLDYQPLDSELLPRTLRNPRSPASQMEPLQFRKLPKCPGDQGCDRIHVKSMTERFPAGVENCDMSRSLFTAGTDSLLEPPMTRFDKDRRLDLYYAPDRDAPMRGLAYIIHGALLGTGFDNDFFNIDVEEAQALAPSQRWILEVLWKAGWTRPNLRGQRIGNFLGDSGSEWNWIYRKQDRYQLTNNAGFVTCSRLAHTLGLTGPCVTCETACSASLVALNCAAHMMVRPPVGRVRSWESRPVDHLNRLAQDNMKDQAQLKYAVCQGVLVMLHPAGWIGECAATMLSYKGRLLASDGRTGWQLDVPLWM
eukprot:Skav211505  [mRNA]  locus=scaffold352:1856:22517:- [translate_table: standard]